MNKNKKNNNNVTPTPNDIGFSIDEVYEMVTNNESDYSTDTFESLEIAKEFDTNKLNKKDQPKVK